MAKSKVNQNNEKSGGAGKVKLDIKAAKKASRKMRTARAGLIVKVPKAENLIRKEWNSQVSPEAGVALAAAAEYILKKVLNSASVNATEDRVLLHLDVQAGIQQNQWANKFITGKVGGVYI